MGYTARQLIAEARSWIGYKEKASNSQLSDFNANAGSGNWTVFAKDLHDAGFYNGNKNGFSWCAVWVDAMHYYVSGRDKKEAQRVTCQSGAYGAVCTYHANYFRAAKRFDQNPQPGDCIYFQSGGSGFSHIGIVEAVDEKYVYTIEGNASDCVCQKKYLRTNSKIGGYGHPLYDQEETDAPMEPQVEKPEEPKATPRTDSTLCKVEVYVLRNGSKGPAVTALQALLNLRDGAGLELDGSFGPLTAEAVANRQKKHSLTVDKVVGPDTWKDLLNNE